VARKGRRVVVSQVRVDRSVYYEWGPVCLHLRIAGNRAHARARHVSKSTLIPMYPRIQILHVPIVMTPSKPASDAGPYSIILVPGVVVIRRATVFR
jgi:hypothetical protein